MAAVPGPRKLVLIESGVYPYAEIELDESVHLSGRNNAGKTSLLNALQFLYIDDIKRMHFPNANFQGKTKPFYFKPHGRSTIMIEADTRWGIRTVGFHGLGATSGCDWQRFGFDGPYAKDDFVDPGTGFARDWDVVESILARKNYVKLTQAQLRAALRGTGEKGAFRLELVPGGGRYETFIEVFRQLLTLRKSRPNDLKDLLLSVIEEDMLSGDEANRGVVSLSSVVGEDYNRAQAAQLRFDRIQAVARPTQSLLVDYGKLTVIQETLPGRIRGAHREAVGRFRDRRRKAEEARGAADEALERAQEWDLQRKNLDAALAQLNNQVGRRQAKLETLRETRDRLGSEPKALLEGRLAGLKEEESRLRVDLSAFQGAADGSQELRGRAHRHRQNRQAALEAAQRLRALDEPGVRQSWLDLLAEYPEEERDPLLRLLNPAILTLPEGREGMSVLDPAGVGRLVSGVAAASRGGAYRGGGVQVNLGALPSPMLELDDPIVRARQIEKFEAQAEALEKDARRLEDLAESSRTRESLQQKLREAETQVMDLTRRTSLIQDWEEAVKELPGLEAALAQLEAECAGKQEIRETAMEEHQRSQLLARTLEGRAKTLLREAQELQNGVIRDLEQRALEFAIDLDPETGGDPPAMADPEFAALLRQAEEDWKEALRLEGSITDRLEEIEGRLDGMIAGDRESKVEQLKDLIDGLPDQKEQLDAAWQHIAVTAKTSFHNLLRDYETLENRVRRLNRAMGKFAVSNLSNIQIQLVPTGKMDTLKQFTQQQGLFTDAGMADRARDQVGEWIAKGEVFRLFDLFQVSLEVSKDGEKETYGSLDAESTGTAVTLKVIFLAHLLRDLYHARTDVRLLIFVDEVDTLDDLNQETIRDCARQLGFTMIMASPNPANARRLYFLRPEGKVTHIYPEESLEVVFRDEPEVEEKETDDAASETAP